MKLALDFSVTLIITSHSSLHTKLKSKIVKEGKRHIKKEHFYGQWEEERGGGDNSIAETTQKKPSTSPKRETKSALDDAKS